MKRQKTFGLAFLGLAAVALALMWLPTTTSPPINPNYLAARDAIFEDCRQQEAPFQSHRCYELLSLEERCLRDDLCTNEELFEFLVSRDFDIPHPYLLTDAELGIR